MAEANKDERTLILKDEEGNDTVHAVADMSDEATIIYNKLGLIKKEADDLKMNADFKLEQQNILQMHYLEALKPLLSSDEATEAEGNDNGKKQKTK